MALYLKDFDKELQRDLRKLALDKGIPLKKLVEDIIRKVLENDNK